MEGSTELARPHWAEGHRRFQRAKEAQPALLRQIGVVTAELRRRVGKPFTLAELAAAYSTSDRWALEAIERQSEDEDEGAGSVTTTSIAADAAFHLYARGASDYRP
jgi:hypothetical protein